MSSDGERMAVQARGIGKEYRLGRSTGPQTLAEALRRTGRRKRERSTKVFRALDDVSFDIPQGSAVGIVGRNGAGKSTLLKLLSRITRPTHGEILLTGRVGSLLEVGTGFHPELTGRENIFMNGAILGMRRSEIASKFDQIVEFAEVSAFLDTPVKRYSSGMYVRLAFSVAAHLEPEVLLVDEVLAVGDAAFQRKCLGRMGQVSEAGKTVLFVSHNTAAIQQLTTSCILLEKGKLAAQGSTADVLDAYLGSMSLASGQVDLTDAPRPSSELGARARIVAADLSGAEQGVFAADADPAFRLEVHIREALPEARFSVAIFKYDGSAVGQAFGEPLSPPGIGSASYQVLVPGLRLAPGRYYAAFGFGRGNLLTGYEDFDTVLEAIHFEVAPMTDGQVTAGPWSSSWGSLRLPTPVAARL